MKVKLTKVRVLSAVAATVVALGVGGAVFATSASADVSGADRDRVGAAAVQAVGGGTVTDVETGDDGAAYEAEVRKDDGTEVDVALDENLKVITQQTDAPDAGEKVLTADERASAEKAALAAVPGGTVTGVEAGDNGVAFEAEVRDAAGAEWDVDLDAAFQVLAKNADD